MSELARHAVLSLIVLFTYFQEAITGFGSTALALPFVVFLLGVQTAVKVLVIQAWLLNGYVVLSSRRSIVWRQYGRIVLFAGLGFPLGVYLAILLPEAILKWVLGVFMVGIAVRGLAAQMRKKQPTEAPLSALGNVVMNAILLMGGIIHGAFGSGGPFVVIYATRALRDKNLFRVTLCMLWFTLNSVHFGRWIISGAMTHEVWLYTAFCTPFTVIGMIAGNHFHHRINEHVFRVMVYAVLLLSGAAVLYSVAH